MQFFDKFAHFWDFIRGMLSDDDGAPSTARTHLHWWSLVSTVILGAIIWHMVHIKDLAFLQAWLGALPLIVGSLIAMQNSAFLINKGADSISDLGDLVGKWRAGGKPPDPPKPSATSG